MKVRFKVQFFVRIKGHITVIQSVAKDLMGLAQCLIREILRRTLDGEGWLVFIFSRFVRLLEFIQVPLLDG